MEEPIIYDETTPFFYVFIRKDLSPAYQIIQGLHAAFEIGRELVARPKGEPPASLCLMEVDTEAELIKVFRALRSQGISSHMFFEKDYDTGYSALATEILVGQSRAALSGYRRYQDQSMERSLQSLTAG